MFVFHIFTISHNHPPSCILALPPYERGTRPVSPPYFPQTNEKHVDLSNCTDSSWVVSNLLSADWFQEWNLISVDGSVISRYGIINSRLHGIIQTTIPSMLLTDTIYVFVVFFCVSMEGHAKDIHVLSVSNTMQMPAFYHLTTIYSTNELSASVGEWLANWYLTTC